MLDKGLICLKNVAYILMKLSDGGCNPLIRLHYYSLFEYQRPCINKNQVEFDRNILTFCY